MAKSVSHFNLFSDHEETGGFIDRAFGALWLVSIGVLLLLNSLGILPWSIWLNFLIVLAKWWPITIIAAGINIIMDGFKLGKILAGILWYVGFLALVFYASAVLPEIDLSDENFPDAIIEEVVDQAQ